MSSRLHAHDPSALLEAAFRRIEHERMAGLPLLNPALAVRALEFGRWQGQWLGALVTPWFMNLVLVPGDAATWRHTADGERVFYSFAAGSFAFLGSHEPEVGEFQTCSLVSTMSRFTDLASACLTARIALRMLHVKRPASMGAEAAQLGVDGGPPRAVQRKPDRRMVLFGKSSH